MLRFPEIYRKKILNVTFKIFNRWSLIICGNSAQFFAVRKQWRNISEKLELKSTKKITKKKKNNNVTVKTLNFTLRTFFLRVMTPLKRQRKPLLNVQ